MRFYIVLAFLLISSSCLISHSEARLPKQPVQPVTTESSDQFNKGTSDKNPETTEHGSPTDANADEHEFPRRQVNPFSLLERLLNMHLSEVHNQPRLPGSIFDVRPMNPNFNNNPFGFYPGPVVRYGRPTILANGFSGFPFNQDPFDFTSSGFPGIPHFARPDLFDMDNDKVPEGYVKVNETIVGPEGHQLIRTTYEKKDVEGPNQFYGIIVKIRPFKKDNETSENNTPVTKSTEETSPTVDSKKQEDRRDATESKPNNTEREVEESTVNTSTSTTGAEEKEKEKPSETTSESEKPDTEAVTPKQKQPSENEIPKYDEAPMITVNDNKP